MGLSGFPQPISTTPSGLTSMSSIAAISMRPGSSLAAFVKSDMASPSCMFMTIVYLVCAASPFRGSKTM